MIRRSRYSLRHVGSGAGLLCQLSHGVRTYTYDHTTRLTQVTGSSLATQFAYSGDGVRVSKTTDGATTQYVLHLAATLPVVICDTEAICLCGLNIIAQQQAESETYLLYTRRAGKRPPAYRCDGPDS